MKGKGMGADNGPSHVPLAKVNSIHTASYGFIYDFLPKFNCVIGFVEVTEVQGEEMRERRGCWCAVVQTVSHFPLSTIHYHLSYYDSSNCVEQWHLIHYTREHHHPSYR
jgi:hypothetical protein